MGENTLISQKKKAKTNKNKLSWIKKHFYTEWQS